MSPGVMPSSSAASSRLLAGGRVDDLDLEAARRGIRSHPVGTREPVVGHLVLHTSSSSES